MEEKYDYGLAISKAVIKYPPKGSTPCNFQLKLTGESKIIALASIIALESGLVKRVIFTGGKTSGPLFPSEARLMKEYILEQTSYSHEENIILEEKAVSTYAQAINPKGILKKRGHLNKKIMLIAPEYQAERIEFLCNNNCLKISGVAYASELLGCNPEGSKYSSLSDTLLECPENLSFLKTQIRLESWLTPLVKYFDKKGKIHSRVSTKFLRKENVLRRLLNRKITQ